MANYIELNQYTRNKSEHCVVIRFFPMRRKFLLFYLTFIYLQSITLLGYNVFFKIWLLLLRLPARVSDHCNREEGILCSVYVCVYRMCVKLLQVINNVLKV